MILHALTGAKLCLNITLVDGLVMASSAFHHSINYRSVVIYGTAEEVTDPEETNETLRKLTNHFAEGRWDEIRQPNAKELEITKVIAVKMEEVSAKVRAEGAIDDKADYELPIWAGVVLMKNCNLTYLFRLLFKRLRVNNFHIKKPSNFTKLEGFLQSN